jgi:uncharacterized membrane protein YdbT with pleckstrin-like domain
MSYVNNSLIPDERVVYRTRLSLLIFTWPVLFGLLALGALFLGFRMTAAALAVLALLFALPKYVDYVTSEFAVTNKRLIVKVGVLRRRTIELQLAKVEAIAVEQSLVGRMFGYGNIVVTGTGGTKEPFRAISGPLQFRRAVQAASG